MVYQQNVSDYVLEGTGVFIQSQSIQHFIHEGKAGMSPVKPGNPGDIPRDVFANMAGAIESILCINQFNGKGGQNT